MSMQPKKSSSIRRPRRVIVIDDSDSSSDEGEGGTLSQHLKTLPDAHAAAAATVSVPAAPGAKNSAHDSILLSDSSSSLEGYIDMMKKMRINAEDNAPAAEELIYDDDASDDGKEDADSAWSLDRKSGEYYLSSKGSLIVSWPKLRIPKDLYRQLYDFQKIGVQWMARLHSNGIGGILGDDMGMGKTYSVLSLIGGLFRARTIRNGLVVAPLSVLRSWEKEAHKILKACASQTRIKVVSSELPFIDRRRILREAAKCSPGTPTLIITTYGLVRSQKEDFEPNGKGSYWDYVIVDEAHQTKNPNAQTSRSCREICANPNTHRILVTGTPLLNNLTEVWSLFDFATGGKVLGTLKSFKQYYAKPIEAARDKYASDHDIVQSQRRSKELQELIKPYFMQRFKKDFLKDKLPPKYELVVWTHLSETQREKYTAFTNDSVVKSILTGEIRSPLEAVTWLKKLCGHPLLVEKNNYDGDLKQVLRAMGRNELLAQSAKLGLLVKMVENLRKNGHRTLIFSQSTKMLDIIEYILQDRVWIARIDGSTKEKDRQRYVDDFNSESSSVEVMLLSTKAAGVGLTLTGADAVIVYDPSWTPAEDAQAVDRAYRISQTKEVQVYRLIAAGTVEEKMYERQVEKDGIRRTVFSDEGDVERHFDKAELRKLFTLAPPGVCQMMEKVQQASRGREQSWKYHDSVLKMGGVVGTSQHDGFYGRSGTENDDDGPAKVPFGGQVTENRVLGRAQRVMNKESGILLTGTRHDDKESVRSLGGGKSGQNRYHGFIKKRPPQTITERNVGTQAQFEIDLVSPHDTKMKTNKENSCEAVMIDEAVRIANNGKEKMTLPSAQVTVQDSLTHADQAQERGHYRRALDIYLHLLEDQPHDLNGAQKLSIHKDVSALASRLKLLDYE